MKQVKGWIGIGAYWILWPLQYIYFKMFPVRSRVLVVSGEEFLVVRPWLGNGLYMLPGGGLKRSESALTSAIRELREETSIIIPESSLKLLGKRWFVQHAIRYQAVHYVAQVSGKPELNLNGHEILVARWLLISSPAVPLMEEVKFALNRYKPLKQTELL